jgi:putative transposase
MPEDLRGASARLGRAPAGPTVHSDWGSQDTTSCFKHLLARHGAHQSISRRGDWYDNPHAKSFWSRFKAEVLDGSRFLGLAQAKLEINYHVAYYNAERRHSALGYLDLNRFEAQLQTTSQLSPA